MSTIQKELWGLLPTTLFMCYDYENSMHFILSLKNMGEEQIIDLVKTITHCGAKVSFDLKEATDFSAIIVDHEMFLDFPQPAFTLDYIKECLKTRCQQDISKYRQRSTRHIASGASCMIVVYYRLQTWSSLVSASTSEMIYDENINRSSLTEKAQSENSLSGDEHYFVVSDDSTENVTLGEQESIAHEHVKLIDKSWKKKESKGYDNVCTTQSNNLLDPVRSSVCNKRIAISKERNKDGAISNKRPFLDDFQPEPRNFEESVISSTSGELLSLNDVPVESENIVNNIPRKPNKRQRKPYTDEERCKILKYIVNHSEYSRLKGREVWEIMERRKVCPSRTWQSMKEHFIKQIIIDLEPYTFLTNEQVRRIKRVFL